MSASNREDNDPAIARLKALEAPARGSLARSAMLAVMSSVLALAQAALVANSLGALATGSKAWLSLTAAAAAFIGFGLLRHAMDAIAGRIAFIAAQKIVADERRNFVHRESLVSPFDPERPSSAAGAALIAGKLDMLLPYLSRYRVAALKVAAIPVLILVTVATISWVAALILFVAGPLIPVFMALIGMAARDASARLLAETGTLNAALLERLNAAVDIKLLNAREAVVAQFFQSADNLRTRTMAVLRIAFLSSTVLELFAAIGIAMVAVYVGFSLLGTLNFGAYGTPLSISEGIFILLLAPDFFAPLRELAAAWHDKASAIAVAGELAAVESRPQSNIMGSGASSEAKGPEGEIAIEGLIHETPSGRRIRYPDFRVAEGEKIAITGPSGTGKTTLLALIAGLAKAQGGNIRFSGEVLDEENADRWRSRLAWVAQNPHFLNASLAANISLFDPARDNARLAHAIDAAHASSIVDMLPEGLGSRLGETGSGVSGGEARRILIARAIYSNANIILADEPTADLDAVTARQIGDALLDLAASGRTLIVSTHDQALALRMDRQISLEEGP